MTLLRSLLIALCLASVTPAAMARSPYRVPEIARAPVVGDAVRVLWGGQWWDAHVIDARADLFKIRYDGWDASWDEWVEAARLGPAREPLDFGLVSVGDDVSVESGGQWWDANVLRVRPGEIFIRYDGYDDSWNEWVGPGRVRSR